MFDYREYVVQTSGVKKLLISYCALMIRRYKIKRNFMVSITRGSGTNITIHTTSHFVVCVIIFVLQSWAMLTMKYHQLPAGLLVIFDLIEKFHLPTRC